MATTGLIGALRITLGIDTSEFVAGTTKAERQLKGFQREFAKTGKQMQNVGRSMSQWITLPVLAAGAGILKMAGDFEAGMIKVGISTQATAAEMATMREMAKQLGADTIFSASEAASGMDMLAKAGIKTTDIIGGAAKAVVDLAAAAGSELDPAASAISDAMLQFNLKASDTPMIVDAITGAVNESKLSFEDFVMAMGQGGGVVGAAGADFKEFATALAGTSAMFHSGSDAGTSFKTFMMRLTPDTKKAREAMEEFGFSAYDAQGQLKPLRQIAEDLQTKFGHLSELERGGVFRAIFGQDAIRTAIGLMKMGGEGFDEMMAKINATDASAQAAARMKGFNAELEQFKGALENLAISIGDSGFLEAMTGMINAVSEFINSMAKTNPEMLKWITIFAAVAAAVGPLAFVFGGFVRAIGFALPLLMKLGPAFKILGAALGYLGPVLLAVSRYLIAGLLAHPVLLGAALLIGGIYLAWKNWDKIGPIVQRVYTAVKTWVMDKLNLVWDSVKKKIDSVKNWFADLYDAVVGNSYIPDMVEGIGKEMAKLQANMVEPAQKGTEAVKQAFQQLQQEVSALLARLFPEEAAHNQFLAELKLLEEAAKKLGWSADETAEAIRRLKAEYADATFDDVAIMGGKSKDDLREDMMKDVKDDLGPNIDDVIRKEDELLKNTKKTTSEMIIAFADMGRDVIYSIKGIGAAIKDGDILGALEQFLDLVAQVLSTLQQVGIIKAPAPAGGGGGPAPGFSTGGSFKVGGSGGVDSQLVRFRATPGEQVDVRRGSDARHGEQVIIRVVKGQMFDTEVERIARPMAADAAQRGAAGGAIIAARQSFRRQKASLIR